MKIIAPRPIASDELAVLQAALLRTAVVPVSQAILDSLTSLSVVGLCECGCRSVYFSPIGRGDTRIADGLGRSISGKRIELMVWKFGDSVSGLDIVDHESSGELPEIDSIMSFAEAGTAALQQPARAIGSHLRRAEEGVDD